MDHSYALQIPQENILLYNSDDEEDFNVPHEDIQLSDGDDEIDAGPVNFNVPQQAPETYFTVPGIHLNSLVYMDNIEYKYYKNISCNNKILFQLTSKMTEAAYKSFFRVVRRVLRLNYAQITIIMDYERALMTAVKSIFPESKLCGCWFHFCQSVIRYCRRSLNSVFHLFQNNPEANRVLCMVLALPHLPAEIRTYTQL